MDCSSPCSSVHGILQAIILECVAISSLRGSSQPRDWSFIFYVSCTDRQILYHWATWEGLSYKPGAYKLSHPELELSGSGHYTETIIFSCPCDTFRLFTNLYWLLTQSNQKVYRIGTKGMKVNKREMIRGRSCHISPRNLFVGNF